MAIIGAGTGIEPDDPYREHLRRFLTGLRRRALSGLVWPVGRIAELLVHRKEWRLLGEEISELALAEGCP